MAARTSSRICCLSWSSGHKHRCTGRSPGCLWQHESDGDDYASLWQPGEAEHPGGKRGAGLGHLLWHPSQEFWALLAPDTPGTRHLSMSPVGVRRTCCLTVTSVGVVRHLCWNCKAVPTQESALTCREQWPWQHSTGFTSRKSLSYFPQAVAFPLSTAGACLFLSISKLPSPCSSFKRCLSPVPAHVSPGPLQPLPPGVPGTRPASHCLPHSASFSEEQLEKLHLLTPHSGNPISPGYGSRLSPPAGRQAPSGNQKSGPETRRRLIHFGLAWIKRLTSPKLSVLIYKMEMVPLCLDPQSL